MRRSTRRWAGLLVAASLVAGCSSSGHLIPPSLGKAYSQAVDAGKHLTVPSLGDIGLDDVDLVSAQHELAVINDYVPDVEDAKSAIGAACRAKAMYESGAAKTQDEAVSDAIALVNVQLSVELVSKIEQRLVRDGESSNPALAAAAVFACNWAID